MSPTDDAGPSPESGLLITAPYPRWDEKRSDPAEEKNFAFLQELVRMVRTLRSECTVTPEMKLRVLVRPGSEDEKVLRNGEGLVKLLAGIGELEIESLPAGAVQTAGDGQAAGVRPAGSIGLVGKAGLSGAGYEVFVFIAEAVDMAALKQKFSKDIEKDRKFIQGLRAKLANEQFVKNAPPELVAGEKAKLEESLQRTGKLESYLHDL
jgi:valyl-tRNA synthetase